MFWATDLTYGSRTYGVECVRQVLVNECAQNSLQHKLRQPCDRVGLSYSTSRFSMKSSKDTPFGLRGVKPNPFSKESQSQRDSKQIVLPWPLSHYFLKWFFFFSYGNRCSYEVLWVLAWLQTHETCFSVVWHDIWRVMSFQTCFIGCDQHWCSDPIQFLSPKQAKMEKCCKTDFLDYTFTIKFFFFCGL